MAEKNPLSRVEEILNDQFSGEPQSRVEKDLLDLIARIDSGGASPEQITQAVEAYLAAHPIEGVDESTVNALIADYIDEHPVDAEIKAEITDVWKAQGELGAKNLLVYPYIETTITRGGITYTVNQDGSITFSGTATSYSYFILLDSVHYSIEAGRSYTLSAHQSMALPSGCGLILQDITANLPVLAIWNERTENTGIVNIVDNYDFRIIIQKDTVISEPITVYPMLRYAEDIDNTWQPYAKTNKELTEKTNAIKNDLAPIIGEYLPTYNGSTSKKRTVEIGGTSTTFYVGAFTLKYGVYGSSLNLEVSAETASGDVVAYNNVSVNSNNGTVTITFDELTEAATFVCKASAIQ